MNELFATISRPGRFKWEADARNDDIAKIVDTNGEHGQPLVNQDEVDPSSMIDQTGQDTVSYLRYLLETDRTRQELTRQTYIEVCPPRNLILTLPLMSVSEHHGVRRTNQGYLRTRG